MTEQEKQLISQLADRIRSAPAPQIDRDAYDLILHTIGTRPDALYILTQTVLIQQMALDQAKTQMDQLQRQQASQPAPQQGGFLPGPQGGYSGSGYAGQGYSNSGYDAPAPPPQAQTGGRFSNFLHNAATTAAGVIAGEVAFDALSSIFGHRGGYYGGGGFLGGGIMPGSETIVNNYYGDERGGDDGGSRFADAASQQQGISPDIDDERDNSGDAFVSGDDSADDVDDSSFDSGDDSGSSDF
jgi:uncharacterized protein